MVGDGGPIDPNTLCCPLVDVARSWTHGTGGGTGPRPGTVPWPVIAVSRIVVTPRDLGGSNLQMAT
jgi:hypothetical protein